MKVSGKGTREMVEGNNFGRMAVYIKGTGRTILPMDTEGSSTQMSTCTSESGNMTKPTAKAHTFPHQARNT